jgi:hypothetical protein
MELIAGSEAELPANFGRYHDAAVLAHHDRGIHLPSVPQEQLGCQSRRLVRVDCCIGRTWWPVRR